MSSIMNYDSLVADIINYTERNDDQFVATIPTIIALTEASIAAELKTLLQLNVVETTLAVNQTVLDKPVRWRKTISMKINGAPILLRGQDYVAQLQSESTSGEPIYYADSDYSHWNFAPKPNAVYPVEIIYYSLIQPLDASNQTNLFTATTPQLMLYGALYHAMVYLKALDKIGVWKGYFDDAMAAVKKEDNSRKIDRNTSIQEP